FDLLGAFPLAERVDVETAILASTSIGRMIPARTDSVAKSWHFNAKRFGHLFLVEILSLDFFSGHLYLQKLDKKLSRRRNHGDSRNAHQKCEPHQILLPAHAVSLSSIATVSEGPFFRFAMLALTPAQRIL